MLWLDAAPSPPSSLSPLIGPALGLLGSLITLGIGLYKDKKTSIEFSKRLDDATKIATFWNVWQTAYKSLEITPDDFLRARAHSHLLVVADRVEALASDYTASLNPRVLTDYEVKRDALPVWRRFLFLYMPARRRAWLTRALFHYCLLFALVNPIVVYHFTGIGKQAVREDMRAIVSDDKASEREQDDLLNYEKHLMETWDKQYWNIPLGFVTSFTFGFIFYRWTRNIERPKRADKVIVADSTTE